jgi:hypothetical protein
VLKIPLPDIREKCSLKFTHGDMCDIIVFVIEAFQPHDGAEPPLVIVSTTAHVPTAVTHEDSNTIRNMNSSAEYGSPVETGQIIHIVPLLVERPELPEHIHMPGFV